MSEVINFEEFKKIDLRVVKIKSAEKVGGSDKLLKLIVEDREGERQIISGIAKSYKPEELIDQSVVIVANLEPRSLMGLESHGMLLAASSEVGPIILIPEKDVLPGTEIR